jgi:asparagine synthase (glutamine-hydrolysing)
MASHDGRFTIIFNGEIYNYVELREELIQKGALFQTQSDTEVILEAWRAWDEDCLTRLRGMYAFALHDTKLGTVHLVRDNFGKKPLFIAERQTASGPLLVFASEIDALLQHPEISATLDVAALHEYLCWRYVPGPNTFFEGIRKLAPGSCLTWKNGQTHERRFWLPPEERTPPPAPADPVGAFLDVFDEAVRLRLRADVPLGAFLSGGLDSASIVASLGALGASEIRTFSIGFAGDPASELPAAAATARAVGTIHTPIELKVDDLFTLLPRLSRHRGAPVAETADLPIYQMSMEAARHVKVVLSGEGSDEMFAGYPKHVAEHSLGAFTSSGLPALASRALLAATDGSATRARRLRIAARALRLRSFEDRMVGWFGALSSEERSSLWTGPEVTRPLSPIPFTAAPGATALPRVLHFDQTSWLPDNLLERMDRMTMAASIEARTPFMDIRLAEFASSLPAKWRINGRVTKRIVREALAHRLPKSVLSRPKNGFRMPVTEWFRAPLRDPFNDLLLDNSSVSGDYLDKGRIGALIGAHAEGRENHDKTLWSLYALETFLREYF